jgi:hypothetical protein
MDPALARIRRFFVALLALGFLAGSSVAATHIHVAARGAGAPAVSTDQHKGDAAEAICPVCVVLHAGSAPPPDAPVLAAPAPAAPAPQAGVAEVARAPRLAFRSRAPPPG